MSYLDSSEFDRLYNDVVIEYVQGRDVYAYLAERGYPVDFSRYMLNFVRWHVDKSVSLEEISEARSYLKDF